MKVPTLKDFSNRRKSFFYDVTAFVFIVFAFIFFLSGSKILSFFGNSFQYQADVISLDNFYNEEDNSYIGVERSVSTFRYETVDTVYGVSTVQAVFDVKTLEGERIVSFQRLYGIDQNTGEHISGFGDKDRAGYLFAPRAVQKDEIFEYWHVNYDAPTTMVFAGEETIDGLLVYRFTSNYADQIIDQTESLTGLDGVPEERHVHLKPILTIWVEPISGYMVNFRDDTVAYFVDAKTKEIIAPWNRFSNTFEQSSIREQVINAKYKKYSIYFVELLLPFTLIILALIFLLYKRDKKITVYVITTLLITLVISNVFYVYQIVRNKDVVSIAIVSWLPLESNAHKTNIEKFVSALEQTGYRDGISVNYTYFTANTNPDQQKENAKLIKKGDYDLIYSLTTPGTKILKEEIKDIPIVFSIVTYPVESGLINSLAKSENNLVGTRNWIPAKRQLRVFLDIVPTVQSIAFVHRSNESNSLIQLGEMREAAQEKGVRIISVEAESLKELEQKISSEALKVDAFYSACDTLVQAGGEKIITEHALKNKIPSFSCLETGPKRGDLLGVVADFSDIGKIAGEKASHVLNGIPPTLLETSTAIRPVVYINKKTAVSLGIIIPQQVVAEAEVIIE